MLVKRTLGCLVPSRLNIKFSYCLHFGTQFGNIAANTPYQQSRTIAKLPIQGFFFAKLVSKHGKAPCGLMNKGPGRNTITVNCMKFPTFQCGISGMYLANHSVLDCLGHYLHRSDIMSYFSQMSPHSLTTSAQSEISLMVKMINGDLVTLIWMSK